MTSTSKLSNVWNSKTFVLEVLLLQFVFLAVVFLDIPIMRQTFVFLYLTFVPGFVLLRVFRLKNLHRLEMILLSAGLGIAFLIIVGLLINELGSMVGISNPLSDIPLMIVLNSVVLLFCFLSSPVNLGPKLQIVKVLKSIVRSPLAVLFLSLPFLSVVGTIWVNAYENNSILLFMIMAISLLVIMSFLSNKLMPPKLYPLAVVLIAVSLLFHSSLISSYVQAAGADIYLELTVFKLTKNNAWWNPVLEQSLSGPIARFNNMLSITILPTIFSSMMNMDATLILKILYPLIFSLVPLALYHLWQTRLGTRIAFASAFLFMAQQTFYTEMLGLARQMVGELFFILLLIVVLDTKIKSSKKIMCFTILSTALIVSHYALSVIFISFLFFVWILLFAMKRWRAYTPKITLSMVVLFFVLMFSWYIYTSNSATFESILEFANHLYGELGEWANPASRGTTVLRGLGMEAPPSFWNAISRGFAYFVQFLIVIGFVGLITSRVNTRLDREYLAFVLLATALLAALILVPGLAESLRMTRFYHILLFFLAPLSALGAEFLVKLAFKRKTELAMSVLLLVVMIPYFLFQTNFVYEVVGSDSWSLPLSKYRMDDLRLYYIYGYIDEQSAFGAGWLAENVNFKFTPIYADVQARFSSLTYCGVTYEAQVHTLSNATIIATSGTIFLNRLNVIGEKILGTYLLWNSSEVSFLEDLHIIYSNGACEIYKKP